LVEERKQTDGQAATIIDVPFTQETAKSGDDALRAFRAAMAWLPVFTRCVNRIEIAGVDPESVACSASPLLGEASIAVVTMSGKGEERALRFALHDRYAMVLKIGPAGPISFIDGLPRLWNLAPLEEQLRSGWLLNGPFAVDPGRGRLAGSIDSRHKVFSELGRSLGDRFLRLSDLAAGNWIGLASQLGLEKSDAAHAYFWARLFDIISADFDDELARNLHIDKQGYGRLAAQSAVIPTRLPKPFEGLVCASEVKHFAAGAISNRALLEKLQNWTALSLLTGHIVASDVAGQLQKIGFGAIGPTTLADLLRREMGNHNRIDVALAARIGAVITPEAIQVEPAHLERPQILAAARRSLPSTG
jgi:hypothetical protein